MGILEVMAGPDPQQPPAGDDILTAMNSASVAYARVQTADDADQAAKAVTIGNALGVSPGLVNADYEHFSKMLEARQSDAVISQNPALISYINSHPLAASVSKGDWGPMDAASKAAAKLNDPPFWQRLYDAFKEGAGDQPVGSWMHDVPAWDPDDPGGSIQRRHKWALEHPIAGAFAPFLAFAGFMPEVSMRAIAGGTSVAGRLGSLLTGSEAPEAAAKVALDPGFWASIPGANPLEFMAEFSHARKGALGEVTKVRQEMVRDQLVKEFLDSGENPPVGLHPDFDAARADQAQVDKADMDAALKAVQSTNTHAISPPMAGAMLDNVVHGDMGISADAIAALYGDKIPHPGDGILGWLPGLQEQLATALDTGGDVMVPKRDWLTNATPEAQKALEDHIRMREDGVTVEEAKTPIQYPDLEPDTRGPVTFETAKGSTYEVHDDGTTTRNKAARDEPGHEGDFGPKPRSEKTVYLDPNDIQALAPPQGADWRIIDHGDGTISLATKNEDGQWGIAASQHNIRVRDTPREGLAPLELWSEKTTNGRPGYSKMHPGNEIVRVNRDPLKNSIDAVREGAGIKDIVPTEAAAEAPKPVEAAAAPEAKKVSHLTKKEREELKRYVVDQSGDDKVVNAAVNKSSLGKETVVHRGHSSDNPLNTEGVTSTSEGGPESVSDFPKVSKIVVDADAPALRVDDHLKDNPNEEEQEVLLGNGKLTPTGEPNTYRFSAKAKRPKPGDVTPTGPLGAIIGFTKKQLAKYQELIAKRQQEDAKAISERVFNENRRRISREWKANREAMRKEHAEEVFGSPVYRLFDHLSEGRVRLNSEMLSEEEKASLPKNWVSDKGLTEERLIDIFKTDDPHQLIKDVAATEAARNLAKMKPRAYVHRSIEAETDRRMEAKYGTKKDMILQEARDQIMSETQEELLHEQTLLLKIQAGLAKEGDVQPTLNELRATAREKFNALGQKKVSSKRFLQDAGRAGRAMENAWQAGDPAEAFRQSQKQQNSIFHAKLAAELEKVRKATEKVEDRYDDRTPKNRDVRYTNAIHAIMQKVGRLVARTPVDLAREMAAHEDASLSDFVAKEDAAHALSDGLILPVPDFLLGEAAPKIEDMTVEEYRAYSNAMQSLDYVSREKSKVVRQGNKEDLNEWLKKGAEQLAAKFDPKVYRENESVGRKFAKEFWAGLHSLFTVFGRFDGRDPHGMFTEMFSYPSAEALDYKSVLERKIGRRVRELGGIANPNRSLEHNFTDPINGGKRAGLTRGNLEVIIANIGNKYNLDRIAFTLGLGARDPKTGKLVVDTNALMSWIERNTTREDIDRAQARGKIFSDLKDMDDVVHRNIYGVAPERIDLTPFRMHGKEYEGWYHPIVTDPRRGRDHGPVSDTISKPNTFWPTPASGHTKSRTGAIDYLDLDPRMIPIKFNQIIHSIAVREFVYNSAKLINDPKFKAMVDRYYGDVYYKLIKGWLTTIAGNASYNSGVMSTAARVSNYFRQSVISTYIAFSPTTIAKHFLTASVMSAKEVGGLRQLKHMGMVLPSFVLPRNYARAVENLFGKDPAIGDTWYDFIRNNSEAIQRRDRNWEEAIAGAHDITFGRSTLRNKIMQWGAKGVALSDMISAMPMWLAKYHEEMAEHGVHGDAVNVADMAVTRQHGSTSAAAVPYLAAQGGALAPWLTSIYGFFGANMQRRIEIVHDLNDAYKLGRGGDIAGMAKAAPGIMSSILAQVIWPAVVEELVAAIGTEDHRGVFARGVSFLLGGLAQSILGVRDFMYGLVHGHDPHAGLADSPGEDISNLIRDLKKAGPMNRAHAGKLVEDAITVLGDTTGRGPKQVGKVLRFGIDTMNRTQAPHGFGQYARGLITGQAKRRVER